MHETITFLLVTLPNIYRLNNVADRLSNKPFLLWLLTTPLQLKHVATLPCSLPLMAGFADINVSRGSVATNAKCGGIFNIYLTTSLPRNLPVAMSLWLHFFGPPCRSNTHTRLMALCPGPSVLWRCWLGGRKGIRPVKTEWWGAGVVICPERGADLRMAQLMPLPLTVSCSSKIQIGFTFLVPAHPVGPGQRAIKRVCVCCFYSVGQKSGATNS